MSSNGISSLLDISSRSLGVQSQAIRVIGNNIANVNTEGYSRRRLELSTVDPNQIGTAALGSGVKIDVVSRIVDKFLNKQLEVQTNRRAEAQIRDEFLTRAEALFAVNGTLPNIGSELSNFFTTLEDLAANPSDIALRSAVIESGRQLTTTIRSTFQELATLQRQADGRLGTMVDSVNQITEKVAVLNDQIRGSEVGAQENLGLRDQRDLLLRELSSKISFQTVENTDGSVNLTLGNGFGLVTGTNSRQLEFTAAPSFAPPGGYPLGLDGAPLGFIVYDFDQSVGTSHIDLTQVLSRGGGEVSGLLELRGVQSATDTSSFDANGAIVDIAARVEAIARDLLTRFNQAYVGPDEDSVTAGHQSSSTDLDDVGAAYTAKSPFGLFTFAGAADTTGVAGLAEESDLTASGFSAFASRIEFGVTSPESLAAGRDLDPADGAVVAVSGSSSNLTGTLGYLGLNQLRTQVVNYSVGNFSTSATIEDVYTQSVTFVGGLKNIARNEYLAARDQEQQAAEFQNSVSGVSLDEEFSKLILFQKAFEASARMIRVGDELLGQVIQLLG